MNIHFNTLVKNEERLLKFILPIWLNYPINKFVFFNDKSTDNTIDTIRSIIPKDRLKIIDSNFNNFNESRNRKMMLDFSMANKADYVLSIDSDELLSSNLVKDIYSVLSFYNSNNLLLYWYNVVENSISKRRNDLSYKNAYHQFIIPIKFSRDFDLRNQNYHSSWRTPAINLDNTYHTNKYGIIHLQSLNVKFYALKQLWYKHYEYVNYKYPPDLINTRYDKNINYLNFESVEVPEEIYQGIDVDYKLFDQLLQDKKYKEFILNNYNEELVTFGKEYLI